MPPADTAPPGSPPRRPSRIDPAELRERSLPSIHSKGASHEAHPTAVAVQVHAVRLPDSLRPSAVTLLLRRDKRRLPVAPYAQCVSLPLSYHKLVFDVLKLDVFQTRIITTTRIAQLRLRLADLPRFDGEFVHELPLFSPASPETQIGTIELHLAFSADPSAVDASQVGANGVSIASGDDASSFESQEQRDIIELIGAFEAARVERDREQAQLDAATGGSASSVSSASSASLASPTSQVPSSHSTTIDPIHPNRKLASHRTSALARRTVVGLTENTLGGLKDLAETAAAFLGTGWKMSKADLASAMLLLSDMQREHPTERTHNVVTDPQQLRIAAYFMDFVLPSYGAVVLNYFGYGRGFLRDALRINPDRKAVLDHAKLAPADILAWEFGLPELFKPNFYIAHDRRTDAIVLTIRGTLNVHECIVDATTEYVRFLDGYTHKGFAESAAWIEAKYLDAIVGWANSLKCNALHVVGHSLGGAVGALFMMSCMDHIKRATHPDFSVRGCFFASPACASMNLVERFSPHMDSFINESDVVPRLSYGAMLDFRELMVAAAGMLRNKALSRADRIAALHELSVELKATNKHPRIYVPGALYYMYKTSRVHASTSRRAVKQALHGKELVGNELVDELEPHYVVERTDPVLFGDVIIRSNMVYHHLLNKYDNSLRKAHDWLEEWSRKAAAQ